MSKYEQTHYRIISIADLNTLLRKQIYCCANYPDSNLARLGNYKCHLWAKKDNKGNFDESGHHIDHIDEFCINQNNDISNLQLLCPSCHNYKTIIFREKYYKTRREKKIVNKKHKELTVIYTTEEYCVKRFANIFGFTDLQTSKMEINYINFYNVSIQELDTYKIKYYDNSKTNKKNPDEIMTNAKELCRLIDVIDIIKIILNHADDKKFTDSSKLNINIFDNIVFSRLNYVKAILDVIKNSIYYKNNDTHRSLFFHRAKNNIIKKNTGSKITKGIKNKKLKTNSKTARKNTGLKISRKNTGSKTTKSTGSKTSRKNTGSKTSIKNNKKTGSKTIKNTGSKIKDPDSEIKKTNVTYDAEIIKRILMKYGIKLNTLKQKRVYGKPEWIYSLYLDENIMNIVKNKYS